MSTGGPANDPTRKQRREVAREQRRALEQAAHAQAVRRTRMLRLGGALGLAVVVVIVAIVVSSSGGSKAKGIATGDKAATTVAAVTSLLKGIPQSANVLGTASAPVTLKYYGDLECPICQEFTLDTLPTLIGSYVRTGKMKIEYLPLETATPDPETFQTQQVAALAAGQQKREWNYVELFYHEQGAEDTGYVTENYLQGLAKQVPGLKLASWLSARGSSKLINTISNQASAAQSAGLNSTPTLIFTGPKGTKQVAQLITPSQATQLIDAVS
jgi:protein-disulfide isomerase